MTTTYPLFSKVALAEDLPEHQLKRGAIATIVEFYPTTGDEEDGYSLEGFEVPNVTIEVTASKIIPVEQWQREEALLLKLRQLSQSHLIQIEDYVDFLLYKEHPEKERV